MPRRNCQEIRSDYTTVFAHEIAHFSPTFRPDPDGRGSRGAVVNAVNEILAARGRPLRAEYVTPKIGSMVMLRLGDAERDSTGKVSRGQDGINVENVRVVIWINRQKRD